MAFFRNMNKKAIAIELLQDVINPRGYAGSGESYLIARKGEVNQFMYDSSNISPKEQRIIDNALAGKSFPIRLGTRYECYVSKFKVVYHGIDTSDDE